MHLAFALVLMSLRTQHVFGTKLVCTGWVWVVGCLQSCTRFPILAGVNSGTKYSMNQTYMSYGKYLVVLFIVKKSTANKSIPKYFGIFPLFCLSPFFKSIQNILHFQIWQILLSQSFSKIFHILEYGDGTINHYSKSKISIF